MPNTTAAPMPETALALPRLAEDVRVHEPVEDGAPWIIQQGHHHYFRVQADLARIARALDGTRDHEGLAAALGPPWTAADVDTAVHVLAAARLLDDGTVPKRRRHSSWIRFVPPLTVQFTLLKPERLLDRLYPLTTVLAGRVGTVVMAGLILGGLLVLVGQAHTVWGALGRPLPLDIYLSVLAGALATTAVHELGHGAVLRHHGCRPSRMGVMLFYLSPAFFCDVSDGWRLPRKQQRVQVALAGVTAQAVIAGAAALAAVCVHGPDLRDGLLVFAVLTYISGLLNLLPFVKFDGYIALMSHLDIPNLRERAMTDARRYMARVCFGGRYTRELPTLRWAVAYGLACLSFPAYLVVTALTLWADALQRLGAVGSSLIVCAFGYFAYRLGRGALRLIREGQAAGARWWRITAATGITLVTVGVLLSVITVPYTISGGYIQRDGGRTELVLSSPAGSSVVHPGSPVRLYRSGVVAREQTGSATVADAHPTHTTAPLSALLPVRTDTLSTPALGYKLVVASPPADRAGTAQLDAGYRSLGAWLYAAYIAPAWRW